MNRNVATLIPHAELALFAQSAHFPDMEEPDRYAAAIKAFIGKEWGTVEAGGTTIAYETQTQQRPFPPMEAWPPDPACE